MRGVHATHIVTSWTTPHDLRMSRFVEYLRREVVGDYLTGNMLIT